MVQSSKTRKIVRVENSVVISEFDVDLVRGLSNGDMVHEIAKKIDMNVRTLENRIVQLRIKTGAKNTPALVAMFFRNKLID